MKIDDIKAKISSCCNDVVFEYNGIRSGITSEVHNSTPIFQAWHGDKTKEYSNVDDVISDKFYSGKSIMDIAENINFEYV